MDKTTSVLAALDAGKLPSTSQTIGFINWVEQTILGNVAETLNAQPSLQGQQGATPETLQKVQQELSTQGRVLAKDVHQILEAYKVLIQKKNADNILQEALYHLTSSDLTLTSDVQKEKDAALADLDKLRSAFRTLFSSLTTSIGSESGTLFSDLLSLFRITLANMAEGLETRAGSAKETLRDIEEGVQKGERDPLGRDKERLREEEEGGAKVKWEHGVDTIRDAGSMLISETQDAKRAMAEPTEQATQRIHDAWLKIIDRAQQDEQYKNSIDTIFSILQRRLNQSFDRASDPSSLTFSNFIADPTPEQHFSRAVDLICQFIERLSGHSLDPLNKEIQMCVRTILQDDTLKVWFNDYLEELKKQLAEPGYARTDEAKERRMDLSSKWGDMLQNDERWKRSVDGVKGEFKKIHQGIKSDPELKRVDEAQMQFGRDLERGLTDIGQEAQGGVQKAVEEATWFWQDLFRVYVPRMLSKMSDIPIPRTEYKDEEIEFVLENLDVSTFNILPSHVYIRNITDIDIATTSPSSSVPSRTAVGTLTHIRVQAVQMSLKDVSFWYKDKTASSMAPNEFTGLLELTLPPKGIDIDIQVRLIPTTVKGPRSREALRRFNVVEKANVSISDDVKISVRESNHSVLMTLFKPIMNLRLKEALERTLSQQVRALVERADSVAWDVGCRKEVFMDTGLGGGGSLVAAVWSELGRLRREASDGFGFRATGTGVVFEQKVRVGVEDRIGEEGGRDEGREKTSALAMGAEPQILSGAKRGPLGTGSEPLKDKLGRIGDEAAREFGVDRSAMDLDPADVAQGARELAHEVEGRAKGMVEEGKKQWDGFRRTVDRKRMLEAERSGWKSASFDF